MVAKYVRLAFVLVLLATTSCMKWEYGIEEDFDMSTSGDGLFICNEGNFQYGNATLSYYDPATKRCRTRSSTVLTP